MRSNGRFFVGLVGVALVVSYLVWTGVNDTMIYYLTPTEMMAKVSSDASFHQVGLKVSGRVVSGTYYQGQDDFEHHFTVADLDDPQVSFPVVFRDDLPDTFTDDVEVVLEGRYREDGVFEAATVLTKCGSRYEAAPEEMVG
jgi:cytochrome c-type biogenesis protein CcmE